MEDSRNQYYGEFDEYLQQTEPVRREKAAAWGIAIGLQAVDGLKPSAYLLETAKRHIEGDISIDEVKGLIDSDKHPTSTRQAELVCDAPSVRAIINVIGERQLSVRQILDEISLKNRENLLDNYLNPAIEGGWVTPLYPQNPRHPRQKYLLTVKGMAFFKKMKQLL